MDDLAHAVAIDPLDFRLKNIADPRLRDVLQAAAKSFGWPGKKLQPAIPDSGMAGAIEKGGYVATCAEVAMDGSRLGRVRVVRVVTAFDCGAIVNPDGLRNQIVGANIMGLGGALFEAIAFDGGRITNARFSRYRVPRFGDVPESKRYYLIARIFRRREQARLPLWRLRLLSAMRSLTLLASGCGAFLWFVTASRPRSSPNPTSRLRLFCGPRARIRGLVSV